MYFAPERYFKKFNIQKDGGGLTFENCFRSTMSNLNGAEQIANLLEQKIADQQPELISDQTTK